MNTKDGRNNQQKSPQHYQGLGDLFQVRNDLSVLHKIFYIATVFLGLVLVWYGVWTAISEMWLLSNPLVATGVGIVLLLMTGKIKDLT